MAKTKKDILYHLSNVSYNKIGAHKIAAFLLGQRVVEKGEKINFKDAEDGEALLTFNHFYDWYTSVDDEHVLGLIFTHLAEEFVGAVAADDWDKANSFSLMIEFLLNSFEEKKKDAE